MFSCEFCEISKNTFLHRTPLVAASVSTYPAVQVISNLFLNWWNTVIPLYIIPHCLRYDSGEHTFHKNDAFEVCRHLHFKDQ